MGHKVRWSGLPCESCDNSAASEILEKAIQFPNTINGYTGNNEYSLMN